MKCRDKSWDGSWNIKCANLSKQIPLPCSSCWKQMTGWRWKCELWWFRLFGYFELFSGSQPSNSSCKATVHYPGQGGGIPFARNLLKPAPSREERGRAEVSCLFIYSLQPPISGEGRSQTRHIHNSGQSLNTRTSVWARLNSNSQLSRSTFWSFLIKVIQLEMVYWTISGPGGVVVLKEKLDNIFESSDKMIKSLFVLFHFS